MPCHSPSVIIPYRPLNFDSHTAPTQLHIKQIKRLLRYLNGTRHMGITYGRPSQDNAEDIKVLLRFGLGG
jgi:hypothetical protein